MSCALAAAVFAACSPRGWRACVLLAAGFTAGLLWAAPDRLPDPAWFGLMVALGAAAQLTRLTARQTTPVLAGVLAGSWSAMLEVQGLPSPAAAVVAGGLVVTAAWLSRTRDAFVPPQVRDEALLLTIALGLVTAVLPTILDGWHAANNLSTVAADLPPQSIPAWIVLAGGLSLAGGACHSLWSRR